MKPAPEEVTKVYPVRGPLQQFRLAQARAFHCFRCGDSKKAKLTAVLSGDWTRQLCNGCYGRLLSIYEIKAGTGELDDRVNALSALLVDLVSRDQVEEQRRLLLISEKRNALLSDSSLRFLATADCVAKTLQGMSDLDWSPAVIGLCKALELEVGARIVDRLAAFIAASPELAQGLARDVADKDFGRIAKYCQDPSRGKPPELGSFGHFLRTAGSSQDRRTSSALLRGFFAMIREWPLAGWLVEDGGFSKGLTRVTTDYRNRAAHIDTLSEADFTSCRDLVLGDDGLLWRLVRSSDRHK